MITQNIILFFGMMIPLTWSAGPNTILCASIGGRFGLNKAIPFIGGLNITILIYSVATGFGLGFILEIYPVALDIVKYAGVIYLFFLAWKIIRTSVNTKKKQETPGFINGLIIGILNAKIVTVTILMYSQFFTPNSNKIIQITILTTGLLIICITGQLLWTIGGSYISKFTTSPVAIKRQNYIFSIMLLMVGIWILIR